LARRTFFSYHYSPDVWRAWNVRNSWIVKPADQESVGFFDKSVFEASRKESADALKRFLREGLENTSVTCVLAGSNTFARRWVRYEIARSIIKGNGLLTVHIHGVKNSEGQMAVKGPDPLNYMGVYKVDSGIYLAELNSSGTWVKYDDYQLSIPASTLWFTAPTNDTVVPLGKHCLAYDYAGQKGSSNIGGWIETAAAMAGR